MLFAAIIWLPKKVIAALAVILLAGHNLVPDGSTSNAAGVIAGIFLHSPFVIMNSSGVPVVLVAYTILPWLGVMMAGYCVGAWMLLPADRAFAKFWKTGIVLLVIFIVLRLINVYGDPSPRSAQPRGWMYTVLSFINVTKYPPSLQFNLLMVGIGMLLLAVFTKHQGRLTERLQIIGQVPFFYFILHLALISLAALIWTSVSFGRYVNLGFTNPSDWPKEYEPNLLRVVIIWVIVVIVLYYPCRWFANYRKVNRSKWLSYL
jgi:uncharacterized membrane protein